MSNDINNVTVVGRLTRDSELKYTNSGTAVCKFSLAVNRKKKSGDEWVEEVSYLDVVLWGRQGEAISQYLLKGKQTAISGELRQNRWEQDGQNRSKVEIIASDVQLLGGPNQTQQQGDKRPERPLSKSDGNSSQGQGKYDDVPFTDDIF